MRGEHVSVPHAPKKPLTAIPTRAKGYNQDLHRHVEEDPKFRNAWLELVPDVLGFAPLRGPVFDSVVEERDGLWGLFVLRIRPSVDLVEDEMSSGFYQGAYPGQRVLVMRQLCDPIQSVEPTQAHTQNTRWRGTSSNSRASERIWHGPHRRTHPQTAKAGKRPIAKRLGSSEAPYQEKESVHSFGSETDPSEKRRGWGVFPDGEQGKEEWAPTVREEVRYRLR